VLTNTVVRRFRKLRKITEQTYYRWMAKYGGMELSEMQRLKQVEDENRTWLQPT
jgi:putative transposase